MKKTKQKTKKSRVVGPALDASEPTKFFEPPELPELVSETPEVLHEEGTSFGLEKRKFEDIPKEEPEEPPKFFEEVVAEEAEPTRIPREQLERMAGGGATLNLTVHGMKPELQYYFSDERRLHELELKGYTHVQRDEIDGIGGGSARAGFKETKYGVGNNVVVQKHGEDLYLMACPKDTYRQVQAYKQGLIDEHEKAIHNRSGDRLYAVDGEANNYG